MIDILYPIIVVILLFGVTIFVHELGHYLVARWCGLKIEVFSIGFGPALWKTKRKGIVYKVGSLPFGGYVALPQMDPSGQIAAEQDPDRADLPDVAPWRKILVALAGATGNVLLAVLLAYVIFWFGKPASPHELSAHVGYVMPDTEAHVQGLEPGDVIHTVNGKEVRNWNDIFMIVSFEDEVVLKADGKTIRTPTERLNVGGRAIPGVSPIMYCIVAHVEPDMSAAEAGVKPGDRILSFAGRTVFSPRHMTDLVDRYSGESAPMIILRDGREMELTVTPRYAPEQERALIGVGFHTLAAVDYDKIVHPRPAKQIREIANMIFQVVGRLLTPAKAGMAADAVGGPVYIISALWLMVRNSFMLAIWFTCLLNINLAILNLLPIPVLDGGHIMFSLWEMVTRRKVSPRVTAVLMYIFVVLLITLMVFLSFRDAHRMGLLPGREAEEPAPVEEVE